MKNAEDCCAFLADVEPRSVSETLFQMDTFITSVFSLTRITYSTSFDTVFQKFFKFQSPRLISIFIYNTLTRQIPQCSSSSSLLSFVIFSFHAIFDLLKYIFNELLNFHSTILTESLEFYFIWKLTETRGQFQIF